MSVLSLVDLVLLYKYGTLVFNKIHKFLDFSLIYNMLLALIYSFDSKKKKDLSFIWKRKIEESCLVHVHSWHNDGKQWGMGPQNPYFLSLY